MTVLTFIVPASDAGKQLDRWLTDQMAMRSRQEIRRWIADRGVRLNGRVAKASYKVEAGDEVRADVPNQAPVSSVTAEDIPLSLLYEDDELLVIDKAPGLPVHPSPGHESGTVLNAVQYLLRDHADGEGGGERRPGLVHRLDIGTSGILLVTKNDRLLRDLQLQFKRRTVYKEYLALVEGKLYPPDGRVAAPIGEHPTTPNAYTVLPGIYKWVDDKLVSGIDGKMAVTDYWTTAVYQAKAKTEQAGKTAQFEQSNPFFSLVRIELHTGRTHQIRVHLAYLKHPIVGDTLYGPRQPRLPIARQFLHAHKLRVKLPHTGQIHEFISPIPPDLQSVLDQCVLVEQGESGTTAN